MTTYQSLYYKKLNLKTKTFIFKYNTNNATFFLKLLYQSLLTCFLTSSVFQGVMNSLSSGV